MTKSAIICGCTGQDGAYLAEFLLNKGYDVIGTRRRSASGSLWRLEWLGIHEHPNLDIQTHDVTELSSSIALIESFAPDEVYNLAAQSFVGTSFTEPLSTLAVTGAGAVNLLEAIRIVKPDTRYYQASTSEMFGNAESSPQNEETPFAPRSPYGCAKLYAHQMAINYREYGLFTTCGILFNHESPLRGEEFVTRKIAKGLVAVSRGEKDYIELGNIAARRDWGHARDFVRGMWLMMQQTMPEDYVLATGKTRPVSDFIDICCAELGLDSGQVIRFNPKFYRPAEIHELCGDYSKAKRELGWQPEISYETLVNEMLMAELN